MRVIYLVVWWVLCLQLGGHQRVQLGTCRKETKKQTKINKIPINHKVKGSSIGTVQERHTALTVTKATTRKYLPSVNPENKRKGWVRLHKESFSTEAASFLHHILVTASSQKPERLNNFCQENIHYMQTFPHCLIRTGSQNGHNEFLQLLFINIDLKASWIPPFSFQQEIFTAPSITF